MKSRNIQQRNEKLMKHSEKDLKKDMNPLEAFIFDEEFSERLWVDLVYIFSIW